MAFTRAKTKLLVVGSKETLGGFENRGKKEGEGEEEMEMVGRFVKLMDGKGWIFDLPKDALTDHMFEVGKTQTQTQAGSGRTNGSQGLPLGVKTENLGVRNAITAGLERKRKGLSENDTQGKENAGLNRSPKSILKSAGSGNGNGNGRPPLGQLRQPVKRVTGMKPFKQPSMMSTTMDIINDARS